MKKLYLIVPYFHKTVICTWNEVWFVAPTVVINAVHTFFMSLQSEVWWRGAQLPHLQRATASASQYGALLFRRQLHHTPDRSYKCQSWGTGLKKAHFFTHLFLFFLTFLEFPGGRITIAFSEKCRFPGFIPRDYDSMDLQWSPGI